MNIVPLLETILREQGRRVFQMVASAVFRGSKRVSETSDPQYSSHSGFGISIRSPIMDGLRRSAAQFLSTTERCWSGRTGLPAKQLPGQNPGRGFESPPLRSFL